MIEVNGLRARTRTELLTGVTFRLEAGVHAVLGGAMDGASLLSSVILGRVRVASGWVERDGEREASPKVLRHFAHVGRAPVAASPLRVSELLALAAQVRREPAAPPSHTLSRLGIEALSERPVGGLSAAELRAVLVAEALASRVVTTILLDEPDILASPAVPRLHAELKEWAGKGRVCLCITSSLSSAVRHGETILLLRRGALVRHSPATDAFWVNCDGGTALQIVAKDARLLARELAVEPDILGIETRGSSIVVRGSDLTKLADAVARSTLRSSAELVSLARCPASLAEAPSPAVVARASTSGAGIERVA